VREDARQRATEFVKELYAVGTIDADQLNASAGQVLAARSETELAGVIRHAVRKRRVIGTRVGGVPLPMIIRWISDVPSRRVKILDCRAVSADQRPA
jgi:hypothetical protein